MPQFLIRMQDLAAQVMTERFAVLQYDRTLDELTEWFW